MASKRRGFLMRVSELKLGDKAQIIAFLPGEPTYRKRLIAMGLLPGTSFEVIRMAPLGDPIEINIRGYSLSLRKHEADLIHIQKL